MVSDKKDNVFRMRVAEITVEVHSLYTDVKEMCREYLCEDKPDVVIVMTEEDIGNERKRYPDGEKMAAGYIETLVVYRKLAEAALDHEILLIHGSAVAVDGKGYLFLAPSGTGKSTQADLWVKYEGSEILNGDRVGLRYLDQHWTAFGLPLAGSSYIYRNTSASVAAIITLEQSPENKIRKLNPIEAFHRLFPETTVHHWHKYSEEKAVSLLINLISNIPVYLLKCRPDKGAVQILKDTLTTLPMEGE